MPRKSRNSSPAPKKKKPVAKKATPTPSRVRKTGGKGFKGVSKGTGNPVKAYEKAVDNVYGKYVEAKANKKYPGRQTPGGPEVVGAKGAVGAKTPPKVKLTYSQWSSLSAAYKKAFPWQGSKTTPISAPSPSSDWQKGLDWKNKQKPKVRKVFGGS